MHLTSFVLKYYNTHHTNKPQEILLTFLLFSSLCSTKYLSILTSINCVSSKNCISFNWYPAFLASMLSIDNPRISSSDSLSSGSPFYSLQSASLSRYFCAYFWIRPYAAFWLSSSILFCIRWLRIEPFSICLLYAYLINSITISSANSTIDIAPLSNICAKPGISSLCSAQYCTTAITIYCFVKNIFWFRISPLTLLFSAIRRQIKKQFLHLLRW